MEQLRVKNWLDGFYQYVLTTSPDLLKLFEGRIMFIPQNDGSINPALNELDSRFATEEQIKEMWDLISTYSKENFV